MSVKLAGNNVNGETIQPIGYPDYTDSKTLTWGSDNSITLSDDGWITIGMTYGNNGSCTIYVDGHEVMSQHLGATGGEKYKHVIKCLSL